MHRWVSGMAVASLFGLMIESGAEVDSVSRGAASAFRHAVDDVQKAAHAIGDSGPAYLTELEKGFRRLQKEYPGEAEVYSELLYVADHGADAHSMDLVREILHWPAPESVKAKAKGVLEKKQHLGQVYSLKLAGIDGHEIDLSRLKGKVVILDFWATWCPPCRKGLPELKALYAKYHSRGLEIVGISFDDHLDKLKTFIEKESMHWPQFCPLEGFQGPTADRFGITSLPSMWLVNPEGRLVDVEARDGLSEKLDRLMAVH